MTNFIKAVDDGLKVVQTSAGSDWRNDIRKTRAFVAHCEVNHPQGLREAKRLHAVNVQRQLQHMNTRTGH